MRVHQVTSVASDSANLWAIACQVPLSMEFSRKNTGVGCQALLQGIFPTPKIKPAPLVSPALAGKLLTTSTTN